MPGSKRRAAPTQQDRLVAELARLIAEENEREDMRLGAAPELVAYTLVRTLNGFVYNDARDRISSLHRNLGFDKKR